MNPDHEARILVACGCSGRVRDTFRHFFTDKSKHCSQTYTHLTPDSIGIILEFVAQARKEERKRILDSIVYNSQHVAASIGKPARNIPTTDYFMVTKQEITKLRGE